MKSFYTHLWQTGRRTFIVNALSRGIAPSVVMKWTGHASYNSMKPYIDIFDTIKCRFLIAPKLVAGGERNFQRF